MLKVRSRLSLLVLVLMLLGAARPLSSSPLSRRELSSAELSSAELSREAVHDSSAPEGEPASEVRAERAPPLPARPQPSDAPCGTSAASTAELDGSPDDSADPELALPLAVAVLAPSAQQRGRHGKGTGARRAVPEAPFKPPNR